ncbi:MAG: DNA polymerase III subunit gamma/tau [Clostridia bacterium]|jgi:DNA polymerase-3 subunit gamma/tau|nr:DNA polymerase III subunit gamma/tau [Clostridia bacterium]
MAYLALYRKYRPLLFKDVIGQDHITQTLQHQIARGQISHAYLFSGSRGTGKTSVAKIFARAVNCLDKEHAPCGKCEVCKALEDPSNLDILEIDAASNNKVDEIRELREKVKYSPLSGKYKVYIIDEVHMLTDSAFNALLKTLEEPPAHALFILATTEVQKLPPTILSRCMRFDFKLISEKQLSELLISILTDINVEYELEAVKLIASSGQGSVRDMLSIADMCVAYSTSKITYNDVLNILGAVNKGVLVSLVNSILTYNASDIFTKINTIAVSGKDMGVLCRDLSSYFRDLMIIKVCENPNLVLSIPTELFNSMSKSAENTDFNGLNTCMQIFSATEQDLKYSLNPRVMLESACLKALSSINGTDIKKKITEPKIKPLAKTTKAIKSDGSISLNVDLNKKEDISLKAKRATDVENKDEPSNKVSQSINAENKLTHVENTINTVSFLNNLSKQEKVAFEFERDDIIASEKVTLTENEKEVPTITPRKIWGKVLISLKKQSMIALHMACGDITNVEISAQDFIIYVYDDYVWAVLSKQNNINSLSEVFKELGFEYNIKIVKKDKQEDNAKQILERLTQKIGDILKVED